MSALAAGPPGAGRDCCRLELALVTEHADLVVAPTRCGGRRLKRRGVARFFRPFGALFTAGRFPAAHSSGRLEAASYVSCPSVREAPRGQLAWVQSCRLAGRAAAILRKFASRSGDGRRPVLYRGGTSAWRSHHEHPDHRPRTSNCRSRSQQYRPISTDRSGLWRRFPASGRNAPPARHGRDISGSPCASGRRARCSACISRLPPRPIAALHPAVAFRRQVDARPALPKERGRRLGFRVSSPEGHPSRISAAARSPPRRSLCHSPGGHAHPRLSTVRGRKAAAFFPPVLGFKWSDSTGF